MRRDRRCEAEILSERRWRPLHHLTDRLSVQELRDIDRLLRLCEAEGIAHIDDITESFIEKVDHDGVSGIYLKRLAKALAALLPGTALAIRAAAVAGRRQSAWRITRPKEKKGRVYVATKTIPECDLPEAWRRAIADMRAGFSSNSGRAPAMTITETIAMKLRQLAKSAHDMGLQADLTLDTLAALHRDMNNRGLSSNTKRATCSALGRFAAYISAPAEIRAELRRLTALHDGRAAKETKRKERILQDVDVSAAKVIAKANELLAEARTLTNPRSALKRRNDAFCLAFFMILPMRLNDTRLTFGEELTWDGTQWNLRLTTSKTEVDYACRVHPFLTPFIDALVLNGLDPAYLETARDDCVSRKRPALITRTGSGVGYNYVSDVWRAHFGTGEHITRTEVHESFAEAKGAIGTELALALCGQTSPETAVHYHGKRLQRGRLTKMQNGMLRMTEDLPDDVFAVP